jgi:inhibitor of cysteine peptidase
VIRMLALAAIGTLLIACAARAKDGEPPEPASFVVAPGQQFDIRLPSNPSTGYRWEVGTALDDAVVKLVGSDFQRAEPPRAAPAATPTPPGSPPSPLPRGDVGGATAPLGQEGIETWRFEAVAVGRTAIELVYVRPWETDVAPARRAVYSVDVR